MPSSSTSKSSKVIGERTFGQGLIKSLIPLEGGASALSLPTAIYFRPNGEPVNRQPGAKENDVWGVRSDSGFEVKTSEEENDLYLKYREERDRLKPGETSTTNFDDRALRKALDYVSSQ